MAAEGITCGKSAHSLQALESGSLGQCERPLVLEQCTSFALCALLTLTKSVVKVCAVVFCVVIAPVSADVSFLFVSL